MWVAQTLNAVNYKKTPWVVVSTHRMMNWMSVDTRPVQVGFRAGASRVWRVMLGAGKDAQGRGLHPPHDEMDVGGHAPHEGGVPPAPGASG